MNDPNENENVKRPNILPESLTKLARTALIYPVRFVGTTNTGGDEFSPMIYVFNVLMVMAAVICGCGSLLGEINLLLKGQSVQFENVTVAVVACFNYTVLVLPSMIAVFGSASRHTAWLDVNRLLDHVDEALDSRGCTAVDKRVERCAVWLICLQVAVSAVDYYIWLTVNPTNKIYGVVYLFNYINLVSLAVYAQLAWCIGRRFDIVNHEIEAKLKRLTSTNCFEFANRQSNNLSPLLHCSDNRNKEVKFIPITKFQEIHWSLCYCVHILNHQYGWQLLTSLLLNIINLISFSNILRTKILNIVFLGTLRYVFITIYVVWLFCHLAMLLLMVLPASYTASKAESTAVSICKFLNVYLVPDDREQLELFVLQMHKHKIRFSIFGVVNLQTSTITKVIGTIISYLLVFIQLQNE